MKRLLILTGCLIVFLTACGSHNNHPAWTPILATSTTAALTASGADTDTTTAAAAADTEDVHQQPVVFPTGPYDNPFPPVDGKDTKFTLTDTQQSLFDTYTKNFNFDTSIFKGANPVDVAQVFIECGNEGLWEGEYNLFYFDARTLSKAQFKAEDDHDLLTQDIRTRRDYANVMLPYLNDGTFVDEGGGAGYIEFNSYENTPDYTGVVNVKSKLNMQQVNGIWLVDQNRMFETE